MLEREQAEERDARDVTLRGANAEDPAHLGGDSFLPGPPQVVDGNTEQRTPTGGPDAEERELFARGQDRAAAAFAEQCQRIVGEVELGADAAGDRSLRECDHE